MKVVVRSYVKSQIRVVVLGAALLHSTTGDFYTSRPLYKKTLHQPKSSRRLPQQNASIPETFFTQRTLTPMPNCFTPEEIYTRFRICLHQEPFTQENLQHEGHYTHLYFTRRISTLEGFYTRTLLHHKAPVYIYQPFTQKNALGRGNLNQTTLTRNNFYTKQLFTTLSFPSETVCTRSLLTPEAFTPGTCTPCNFHTRRRFQQKFSHQRIFTAKLFKSKNGFYNRICWHLEPLTPSKFYTKELSHHQNATPEALHTKELLHRTPFGTWGKIVLFTKTVLHQALQQKTFTPETIFAKELLHHWHILHQKVFH